MIHSLIWRLLLGGLLVALFLFLVKRVTLPPQRLQVLRAALVVVPVNHAHPACNTAALCAAAAAGRQHVRFLLLRPALAPLQRFAQRARPLRVIVGQYRGPTRCIGIRIRTILVFRPRPRPRPRPCCRDVNRDRNRRAAPSHRRARLVQDPARAPRPLLLHSVRGPHGTRSLAAHHD